MSTATTAQVSPIDKHSYSNNHEFTLHHVTIDWTVDLQQRVLSGSVVHALTPKTSLSSVTLDSRNLKIIKTSVITDGSVEKDVEFSLLSRPQGHPAVFGHALKVSLPSVAEQGKEIRVKVYYETTQQSEALQWLEPAQTAGKQHPFLYSQCEAIHARSLLPCVDSPQTKCTYDATVRIASPLKVVMSALPRGESDADASTGLRTFLFEQKVPIPSYLIFIGAGVIDRRQLGPRSSIWAEPASLEAAAWEFSETEQFIAATESIVTPYAWTSYDMLLLPASFPYGGMENPNCTTLTPSLLAGDRSLVAVVAHELAHSWSGNLVTNATWEDFWLNEGFTVFLERRIVAHVYGEQQSQLQWVLGLNALRESVQHFAEIGELAYTEMRPKLDGVDPDDSFSSVPYEKGANFLYYLCQLVGGYEPFESFLKSYFARFANGTVTAESMKHSFLEFFKGKVAQEKLDEIEWDKWLHERGMPSHENKFDETLVIAARNLADKWAMSGGKSFQFSEKDVEGWSSHQTQLFLDLLTNQAAIEKLDVAAVERLGSLYGFKQSGNAEIKYRYYLLALKLGDKCLLDDIVKFVTSIGRMKFVRPLYRTLFAVEKQLAVDTFVKHRSFYSAICAKMLAKDLKIEA